MQLKAHNENEYVVISNKKDAGKLTFGDQVLLMCSKKPKSRERLAKDYAHFNQYLDFLSGIRWLGAIPGGRYIKRKILSLLYKTRYLRVSHAQLVAAEKKVDELLARGLLVKKETLEKSVLWSLKKLSNPILPVFGGNNRIENVCIPTYNRSQKLEQLLNSVIENNSEFGRNPTVIVMDDSKNESTADQTKIVLKKILEKNGTRAMRYGNRLMRKNFSRLLSNETGVRQTVTDFLLLGEEGGEVPTGGSNRNSLILDSIGSLTLQLDDDMIVENKRPPENVREGIALTCGLQRSYWPYENFDEVAESGTPFHTDYLKIHEDFLGKSLYESIRHEDAAEKEFTIEYISEEMLHTLSRGHNRILSTFTGSYGDSGMAFSLPNRNFGDSLRRLTKDRDTYQKFKEAKFLAQAVQIPTICRDPWCISMNIGLDVRVLPPFFSPVQREDDTVFGMIAYSCFRDAFSMQLPYMILHNRNDLKTNPDFMLGLFRATTILSSLIQWYSKTIKGNDSAKNLFELGTCFKKLGGMNIKIFKETAHAKFQTQTEEYLQGISYRLFTETDVPQYWRDDMARYANMISTFVTTPALPHTLLWDMPGNEDSRWMLFQKWVENFGDLLCEWPNIFEATKTLKSKGIRISEEING